MKKIISILLGTALGLSLLAGCGGGENPEPSGGGSGAESEQGTASALGSLESFSAGTLDGGTFTQADIQEKDITVLNVWALTCGPCIAELPDLAAFAKALPDNVQLVTVCLDAAGNESAAQDILEEAGFEGTTLISGDGDLQTLCGNLMYTPTTVLVNDQGSLVGDAIIGGQRDLSGTFLEAVNKALKAEGKDEISLEQ